MVCSVMKFDASLEKQTREKPTERNGGGVVEESVKGKASERKGSREKQRKDRTNEKERERERANEKDGEREKERESCFFSREKVDDLHLK